MTTTPPAVDAALREKLAATRRIDHAEAREIAQRLINSHFRQEPGARIGIPARPDYDDDLLICAYIDQQAILAALSRDAGADVWQAGAEAMREAAAVSCGTIAHDISTDDDFKRGEKRASEAWLSYKCAAQRIRALPLPAPPAAQPRVGHGEEGVE